MNDEQFAFFRTLVETTGPSGYEVETQRVWRERVSDAAAEISTDALGNCVAVLNPGARPSVMLDAHIDEIGFLVKYIDENGFLYFGTIGGFDPATLAGNRVRILGKQGPVVGVIGRKPSHLLTEDERKKAPELKTMWIDIGARDRADAETMVRVGDAGGRANGMERLHANLITSCSLDDRVGGYVMAETFRNLASRDVTAAVHAASSTQEEIGLRGARVSAYTTAADIGIALEVTWTSDHPQSSKTELGDIRVGAGPALFRGPNVNPRVFDLLQGAAEAEGIPYQVDVYAAGSPTDGNVMQMSRGGMAVGIVSIPTRYLHTASEVISLDDVDAAVTILTRFTADLREGVDLRP
jgi:putative aminopeptidase FrvX